MPIYTGVADANGDFNISFGSNHYTSGEKITVTAEKDSAEKTIELYAPSEVTGGGFIQISGTLNDFPKNIGIITLSGLTGVISSGALRANTDEYNIFKQATGLVMSNGVTEIGSYAFAEWDKSKYVVFAESATIIREYAFIAWLAFNSHLVLPHSITKIETGAFQSWISAKSLEIGSGILSISNLAFGNWYACETITVHAVVPPTITADTFQNLNGACIFKVPASSVAAYKAKTNWKAFASRIQAI